MATPQQKCKIINFEPTAMFKFLLDSNSTLHINRFNWSEIPERKIPMSMNSYLFLTSLADQKPNVNDFYVYKKEIGCTHLVFCGTDLD